MYWSRYSYPFGIMVNVDGRRFVDEGETWRGLTYAKTGRAILSQPVGLAFQIFDAEQRRRGLIRGYKDATVFKSNTLDALAKDLEIHDVSAFLETVRQFNESIQDGEFHPFHLDGKSTSGITPPKSNWALPIATPPFEAYPTICGMTFTYGGLKITPSAEVLHESDRIIPGLYAAGEMVGGLWHDNYPSGGGMMAGAVFGRIAGTKAAQQVLSGN
ncbi:MAG: FAD-binding protein [Chloroflexi bacterium]|nr:FAD-binding protein [Chloroflexota bacterium]